MQLRKILCPIDFSDSSRAALRFAVDMATQLRASLAVVYVWQAPLWATAAPVPISGDALQAAIDSDAQELEHWAAEARGQGAADVTWQLLQGVPWERIVHAANADPKIDLIVMGTHGRTGIKAALIGSVAEKVVRHAPCRVLVTRDRAEQS